MTTVSSTSSSTSTSSTDYLSFDTATLVEAKLASRYARMDSIQTEIDANQTKIAAYQDMQNLLLTLQETLQALRADPSSTGKEDNVFLDRSAYLTSTGSTSASTYMSATVKSGTDLDSHTITISQVATANKLSTTTQSSRYTALGVTGTISLGTEGGGSAEISITSGMSLGDIADTINAQKSTTGVGASIMKVSDSSYMLVLTTTSTGETITASDVSGTLLSDTFGLLDGNGDINSGNVLQEGKDAILTVDGVTITRNTNDIDDVLDGVTLHLYAATSDAMTLSVENDLDSIKTTIQSFIDAYNSFRDFVLTNQTVDDDGSASDSATLFGDGTLRSIAATIQTALSSSIDEASLALIGITFDSDNKLVLDETALDNALLDNLSTVQSLFTYSATMSSGDLGLVRHPDASFDFTLDLSYDGDGNLVASVDGDSSLFTVNGTTITGTTGTIYEGLTFAYTGSTAKAISVMLTQGIADQIYNDIETVADEDNGTLTSILESLQTKDSDLDSRLSTLTASTETYATYLYSAYSTIAGKLAAAQTTLALLEALLNANSS
jgi:Flagellar capping protein